MANTLPKHNAEPGDLIEIFRGMYEEWAVFVGDDKVVYVALEGQERSGHQSQMTVKCDNIWNFIGSHEFKVNNRHDGKRRKRRSKDIVDKARGMVGKKWSCPSDSRKSERFVTELRYEQHGAKLGDLIEIFRSYYNHWAVYVGDEDVVHLTNTGSGSGSFSSPSSGQVTRDNIWKVVGSDKFQINNLLDGKYKPRDPQDIVKEACAMVGQPAKYSLTSRNCEHFATELRYGKGESRQVQRAAEVGSTTAAAAGITAVLVGSGPVPAAAAAATGGIASLFSSR